MGSTNRNHKRRGTLGDLSRGWPYLRPIPKISFRQPFVYVKGVGEDELDEGHGTLSDQDKQPWPKR
jgi:hypothetical protein